MPSKYLQEIKNIDISNTNWKLVIVSNINPDYPTIRYENHTGKMIKIKPIKEKNTFNFLMQIYNKNNIEVEIQYDTYVQAINKTVDTIKMN